MEVFLRRKYNDDSIIFSLIQSTNAQGIPTNKLTIKFINTNQFELMQDNILIGLIPENPTMILNSAVSNTYDINLQKLFRYQTKFNIIVNGYELQPIITKDFQIRSINNPIWTWENIDSSTNIKIQITQEITTQNNRTISVEPEIPDGFVLRFFVK